MGMKHTWGERGERKKSQGIILFTIAFYVNSLLQTR